jgi:hypothetical protein
MPTSNNRQFSIPSSRNFLLRAIGVLAVLAATSLPIRANAQTSLLVVGPAESVDVASGVVQVLGQRVTVAAKTRLLVGAFNNSGMLASAGLRTLRQIEAGQMLAVWSEDGKVASDVYLSRVRSIPGASQIYLNGIVTAVDLSTGFATIGGTKIDLTALLFSGALDLQSGDRLQVLGTQPTPHGVILASDFAVLRTSGIGGTSTSGIGGTSVNGIGGTSVNGIGGTSVNGIGGTSVNGIGGTSVNGIGGTSVNGIGGTSTSGIGGTSVNGIGGTSTSGIGGTSVNGIGGTSVNGIGGTSTSGIGGTSSTSD